MINSNAYPFLARQIIVILFFFIITPLVIGTSMFALVYMEKENEIVLGDSHNYIQNPQSGVQLYASLPSDFPSVSGYVVPADARVEIIRNYLTKYDSPLVPYAEVIVESADNFGLDFRLTTAIAQQESNLCKKIPPESYNCWGWGIHSRGTLGFVSYTEGIQTVSKGLRENYLNEGLTNLDDIMSRYTPLSDGSWAYGVNKFMSQMQ